MDDKSGDILELNIQNMFHNVGMFLFRSLSIF